MAWGRDGGGRGGIPWGGGACDAATRHHIYIYWLVLSGNFYFLGVCEFQGSEVCSSDMNPHPLGLGLKIQCRS